MKNSPMLILLTRMREELRRHRSWLLSQPPELILDGARSFFVQQDIVYMLENEDLLPEQVQALLKSALPLEQIAKRAASLDATAENEALLDVTEKYANELIEQQRIAAQRVEELRKSRPPVR